MKRFTLGLLICCAPMTWSVAASSQLNQLMMSHYEEAKSAIKPVVAKQGVHEDHILVLFFSNQCPHCINFAPILKRYAEQNQWSIEAVTLNDQTLAEFPDAIFATQEMIDVAYQGKPVVYPALFVANTKTKALYPVSFGELGVQELEEKMSLLSSKIKTYEESH